MADYDADMIIRDVGHRTRELRNVDYILLAEFDIDQGSMLKYEVPYSTGIDSQKLAELMLPDGAHLRDEDWTVFFLNKDLEEEFQAIEHEREAARARTRVADAPKKQGPIQMQAFVYAFVQNGGEVGWEQVDNDKKMLVLNKDNVTIMTRGREELIRLDGADDLQFTQLEPMFTCAFTDASAVGLRFSSGAEEDLFQAHCEKIITDLEEGADDDVDTEPDTVGDDGDEDGEPETTKEEQEALIEHYISLRPDFLYGLNLVRTKKNKDWVRGAKVKAMAVCTRFQFVHVFKPLLILALENFFAADPEEGLQIVQELFESINAMDLSEMPDLSEPQKLIQRNALDQGSNFFTTHCLYREVKIPVRVPLAMLDDEVGDVSVISLVNKFGPDVMTIYNSLLCERRIIFLGYNRPANEVCNYVLAAIQMICPPMRGLVRRAFPYINLHNMSFLGVNGFIAGATNLIFQEREMWWDILCDLETGRVTLNPTLAARLKENPETSAAADAVLFGEVMYTIESHFGEDRVRNLFQNYTQHLIDLVLGEAEWPDDKARSQDMDANAERMALVKATDTFAGYDTNLKQLRQQSAIKNFEVVRHIRKLSIRQDLTDQEMMAIYTDFTNSVESQEQLEELLTFLPAQDGGLFPVAMGLFHPNVELRRLTVELLKRIEMLPAGQALFESLNEMVLLAFERNRHLVKDRRAK